MTRNEILERLRENQDKLRTFGTSSVGLFGSYATGNPAPASDIDVLVTFASEEKKTFDNYMGLKFFLEEMLDMKHVDLVIADGLKPGIRKEVLRTVVYAT
jgi:predicted nucleotidyltransferase